MQTKTGQTADPAESDPRLVSSADLTATDSHSASGPASCNVPDAKGAKDVPDAASGSQRDLTTGSTQGTDSAQVTDATGTGRAGEASDTSLAVALVVVAHSPLASALRDIAQHVFGHDAPITAIDVLPGACAEDSGTAMLNQIKVLDQGAGVLIMTDLPGASPCNVCASAAAMAREQGIACEVITGVNAAMVLRAISYREQDIERLAQHVIDGASKAVMRVE